MSAYGTVYLHIILIWRLNSLYATYHIRIRLNCTHFNSIALAGLKKSTEWSNCIILYIYIVSVKRTSCTAVIKKKYYLAYIGDWWWILLPYLDTLIVQKQFFSIRLVVSSECYRSVLNCTIITVHIMHTRRLKIILNPTG